MKMIEIYLFVSSKEFFKCGSFSLLSRFNHNTFSYKFNFKHMKTFCEIFKICNQENMINFIKKSVSYKDGSFYFNPDIFDYINSENLKNNFLKQESLKNSIVTTIKYILYILVILRSILLN